MLRGITARTLFVAAVAALLCAIFQFYMELQQAQARSSESINQLISTLEEPAARAVLILDAELANDIAVGLVKHDFVIEAKIYEDHNVILGEAARDRVQPHSGIAALLAAFVAAETHVSAPLRLPESMSEATGKISIRIDEPRAVATAMTDICMSLALTFLVSLIAILAIPVLLSPRRG